MRASWSLEKRFGTLDERRALVAGQRVDAANCAYLELRLHASEARLQAINQSIPLTDGGRRLLVKEAR